MKQHLLIINILVILLLAASCKKVETEPRDWILEDLVWDEQDKNATLAAWFLNDVYNYIPTGFNRISNDFLDAASGDAIPSRNNALVEYYTNGRISVLNNPDPYWGNSYYGIRRANIFLHNIDDVPAAAQSIIWWKAEARFIRALLYFEMLKRYGGIPLIGDTVFTLQDNLELPRNTYEQCVNYIVSECDAIKNDLRGDNIGNNDWGRITKGAAIALKCRVFLYAASPLFNGGGIATDPLKKALTGYPTHDPARWQKVIDAAEELKNINFYALQTGFASVFTNKKNAEVILAKQGPNNTSIESQNAPMGYGAPAASQGLTSPTQEFVDAFPMDNGLPITDAASTYNPDSPYTRRDPRLGATVFFNKSRWLNRDVETFDGGLDRPGGNAVQTRTGYYLRKFMADFSANTSYTNQSHNYILFRYSEILLNLAEALNEMNRVEDAVAQLVLVRKRAGIKAGTDNRHGIPAGISQDDLRTLIYNDRRIELAFEEHRFWDLRRWKLAPQALNGTLHGMRITKQTDGTFTYQRVPVIDISFQNRLYHMPIPYSEVVKNRNMIQNEGW